VEPELGDRHDLMAKNLREFGQRATTCGGCSKLITPSPDRTIPEPHATQSLSPRSLPDATQYLSPRSLPDATAHDPFLF
jgi:hypothetical protein